MGKGKYLNISDVNRMMELRLNKLGCEFNKELERIRERISILEKRMGIGKVKF